MKYLGESFLDRNDVYEAALSIAGEFESCIYISETSLLRRGGLVEVCVAFLSNLIRLFRYTANVAHEMLKFKDLIDRLVF
jgi:hypothetical protein